MLSYSQSGAKNPIPSDELFWPCLLSSWPISLISASYLSQHFSLWCSRYVLLSLLTSQRHFLSAWTGTCHLPSISRPVVLVHWLGGGGLFQKFRLFCWDAVTCLAAARFCGYCFAAWNVSLSPKSRQPWWFCACQDALTSTECPCTPNTSVPALLQAFVLLTLSSYFVPALWSVS